MCIIYKIGMLRAFVCGFGLLIDSVCGIVWCSVNGIKPLGCDCVLSSLFRSKFDSVVSLNCVLMFC